MSDYAPETGPDGRPRPRYGEYATPEEQAARITEPDASYALDTGQAPAADVGVAGRGAAGSGVPASGAAGVAPWRRSAPDGPTDGELVTGRVSRKHPADRIVTIALLVYGAFNVIFSAMSYFSLADVATEALRILGSTAEFTNFEAARLWGPIAAIVLVVGYLITLLLSVRRLRMGRLTWWVPLVGAAATYIVVYICLAIPLLGDPAFIEYATTR